MHLSIMLQPNKILFRSLQSIASIFKIHLMNKILASGVQQSDLIFVTTTSYHPSPPRITILFLCWELLRSTLLGTKICNTVLLTIVPCCTLNPRNLFYKWTFVPFDPLHRHFTHPQLFFFFFFGLTYKWDHAIFVFLWQAFCLNQIATSQSASLLSLWDAFSFPGKITD